MQNMHIRNYADAVYHVKRGFLIIGLTGYTGSGCSTLQRVLTKSEKPQLPDYASFGQTNERDERIYQKLKRTWDRADWVEFTSIEVAKVIFAIAVNRALNCKKRSRVLDAIRALIPASDSADYRSLRLLVSQKSLSEVTAKDLVHTYKKVLSQYEPFKKKLGLDIWEFVEQMQDMGDEIRRYGIVSPTSSKRTAAPQNIFVLPEALRRLIKAYRLLGKSHFVIDAFRNPYEVEYFRRRYSEFYLVGVLREEEDRRKTIAKWPPESIERLESREKGAATERKKENIWEWVTSQNIDECLSKADVYINNALDTTRTFPHLRYQAIKVISLARNPGCIPPNNDERSMQIAMTARHMSGCISRQVGAVVLSKDGYTLGIGWNDPPQGQIPCSLRTAQELVNGARQDVYSNFERSSAFISHIQTTRPLELPFCFREELPLLLRKPKMAEWTRALHAEENALFQASWNSGEKFDGAVLYTTACTCTLCAKKAYQLGVKRIVYIDDYPGIAIAQTIQSGKRAIEVSRFEGVTGSAYFRLFGSLMPEKDLINLYV